MDLVELIYNLTKKYPDEEKYSLVSQLRRAAISVPSNIAEGASRNTEKDFCNFLYIAFGSLAEIETQVLISQRLQYISDVDEILSFIIELRKMINSLIKTINE